MALLLLLHYDDLSYLFPVSEIKFIFPNRIFTMTSNQGVLTLAVTVVLLALPSLTYGETLHVRPTSINTSCPMHSCYTLSEYTQDLGQYFNDPNLTLPFLPGNHTLDVNIIKTNIHQLELLGNFSAAVTTTVVCSSKIGLSFRHISKVRIDCLAFVCVPDYAWFPLVMIMTQFM